MPQILLTCHHCGTKDAYNTGNRYINCHKCGYKIFIKNDNTAIDAAAINQGATKLAFNTSTSTDKIRVVPWGDVHVGAPSGQCDWNKAQRELDYVLNTPDTYLIGMGDYMDCAQRMPWQKGPNIYASSMMPMEQFFTIEAALKPLAQAGKIVGLHAGNHEEWIMMNTGIQITDLLCKSLHVPFLGAGCLTSVHVNNQTYQVYSQHGYGSAQLKHTKLGRLMNSTKDIFADVLLMGHTHQIAVAKGGKYNNGRTKKSYYVLTGHFLRWEGSYAQLFGLDVCPAGTVKLSLFADRHDIHISA